MSTVCGRYVKSFAEANMGMLEGASLNAPYDFHWVYLIRIEGDQLFCKGGLEELQLPWRSTPRGDRAKVTIKDPIFGPVDFEVHPFLSDDRPPIGGALGI